MNAVINKDEWLDVLAKIQDLEKRLEVLEDTKYTARQSTARR